MKNQHISFLLSNRSSWREMCGCNLDLITMCQFYSLERCIHENLDKSLPPFPPALSLIDEKLRALQVNSRKQVIKVLPSRIYANIAY